MRSSSSFSRLAALAGLSLALAACETTTVVQRELFVPPAEAARGFLGYFDAGAKLTTCGNCHVGKQSDWVDTRHASAFESQEATGNGGANCYPCHTVNERGNYLEGDAGHLAIADTIYRDVQCESCHGPGLTHVTDPDAGQPLASISADTAAESGCGECHSGAHNPFVEQWRASRHGSPQALNYAGSRSFCAPCHEGRTALRVKFGETAPYLEEDGAELQPFTCAVCHDPHGSPYDAQLRAPIDVATNDHLCVKCHARRGTPPSSHGPHAPQGLIVLGENVGWIPPNFQYDTILLVSSHGSASNPKLCATCHVPEYEITNPSTGDFVFRTVGHLFEAVACVDSAGIPVGGECTVDKRDFKACTSCHVHTEASARTLYTFVTNRMNNLLDELWTDTDNDHELEATDGGLLPKVLAKSPTDTTQFDVRDRVVTVAEGAMWNAQLAFTNERTHWGDGLVYKGLAGDNLEGVHFGSHKGSGNGVHNPFLLEALLTASIQAVKTTYSVSTSPAYNGALLMTAPPGVRQRTQ